MKKIYGFAKGKTVLLEKVSDPVFAEKMLGDGIAIYPDADSNIVTAPFDGVISLVANTSHAVGINTAEETEFLIHIGLETVSLKGEGFTPLVSVGEEVKCGQPLMEVDWKFIDEKKLDKTVILVNCDSSISNFTYTDKQEVTASDVVLEY